MKKINKILSCLMAITLVLTMFPVSISTASAVSSIDADASLVLNRPQASVIVTEVTRVAYQANSMKAPSGNNSVIVKSTPSGIPYLSSTRSNIGYAGETPVATTIVFTPGVLLDEQPTLTCTNSTVKWTGPVFSNGTYTWTLTGGTAMAGTTLVFNVNYDYSEVNPVTGKTYTHSYVTSGTSYVEAIATPAGLFTTKRTYENWVVGTTTKNRSYLASYILGKNTYGSIYDNGSPDGSVAFATSAWANGGSWSAEYGMMQSMNGSDASRDFNVAYKVDSNRPMATVYFDKSITSTLSDLNLRGVSVIMNQSSESDEIVTVTMKDTYVLDGFVQTAEDTDEELSLVSDDAKAAQLNITKPTTSLYALASNFSSYFTGSGAGNTTGTNDYTVVFHYQTANDEGWNDVRVSHTYNLRIVSYDKGALRTLVENVQSTDPTVKITGVPEGDYKGYNPQSWYYSSGYEAFSSALNSARSCLDRPDITQETIDTAYDNLVSAYEGLQLRTADYSMTGIVYNQALNKNPNNYTLASWAKLQTLLDSYRSDYSVLYQPAVDKLGADIRAAMEALEERNADYSVLLGNLETVNGLINRAQNVYGKSPAEVYSGWANLISVLDNCGCVYNELDGYIVEDYLLISEQAKVDGYVILIERALNGIGMGSADYTESKKAEQAYKAVNITYVVSDIASYITSAYNNLISLRGLDVTHQAEIDNATAELNYWLDRIEYKPADISAAEAKIAYANSLDRSLYNDFSGVDKAIANLEAKLTLDIRYQNEINRAVTSLQSAIDKLNANSADYTQVDLAVEAVAERERLILETYEDSYGFTADTFYTNWNAVTSAVNNVVRGLDLNHQSQVDGYATAINNALDGLMEKGADYTEVTSLGNQAYTICTTGSSLYTQESINALLDVYLSVENGLTISEQARVDGFADAIQEAIDSLEYLPANYTAVNTQISAANAKIAADEAYSTAHPGYSLYTYESMTALEMALAEVAEGLDIRYQSTVSGYTTDISAAVAALVYAPADYTAVEAALANVPDDTSIYTTVSLSTLNAVINSINYSYTADKQATVDKYINSINSAIGKLKLKTADYTAVNQALNAVPTEYSIYTEDSWQALQDQVNAVVTGYPITRQSEVDTMAVNINTALSLLALKGADYSAFDEAKENIPADLTLYTDESVAVLNAVLESVDYYCDINHQSVVDGYVTQLNNAIAGLQLLGADYSKLEIAVTEAQTEIAKGWYTEESVSALQAKLDAVVRNLDITHQSEVDNWENSIVNATKDLNKKLADYTELQNILNLLDNSASEIYTIQYTNFDSVMSLIVSYRAENVKMDITIDRQSEVDLMALTLQGYIESLVPYVAPEESFEFVNGAETKDADGVTYVFGFTSSLRKARIENYVECEGTYVELELAQGSQYIGTGSVIRVYSESTDELLGEYIVVIFGDIDGDAKINDNDVTVLADAVYSVSEPLAGAARQAANIQGTGSRITINGQDLDALTAAAYGEATIDQSTGHLAEE